MLSSHSHANHNPHLMMAPSKSTTLELTLLSVEGLRVRGKPLDKSAFAVVHAESLTHHTTATAKGNNGFHEWNEKFMVEIGARARSLTFQVKSKTGMGAMRDVGVARIALSDFLGGLVPDHCLQFLCYRLRDWDGRECGIVNFSVRVVAPPPPPPPPPPPVDGGAGCSSSLSSTGVVTVTGIPVWMATTTTRSTV